MKIDVLELFTWQFQSFWRHNRSLSVTNSQILPQFYSVQKYHISFELMVLLIKTSISYSVLCLFSNCMRYGHFQASCLRVLRIQALYAFSNNIYFYYSRILYSAYSQTSSNVKSIHKTSLWLTLLKLALVIANFDICLCN